MAPAALTWLYHNLAAEARLDWLAAGVRAAAAADQENSSGGPNARWIAMWPVRSLVHLVVLVTPDNWLIGADSSIRHRNIVLAPCRELMSDRCSALAAHSLMRLVTEQPL
jgi:hypothetical protein